MNLMNLKGKLNCISQDWFSAVSYAISMSKTYIAIHNTTTKYTINMIQETNIQYNNKIIHDTTKTIYNLLYRDLKLDKN